jgi:hypothetical protein
MPVEHVNLPVGPDETLACAQLALYLGTWRDVPFAVMVMAGDERSHFQAQLTVEVLAPRHASRTTCSRSCASAGRRSTCTAARPCRSPSRRTGGSTLRRIAASRQSTTPPRASADACLR